ncbi:hypothetical protein ABQE57_16060 [Mycolicibacterium elephantis]|uniref:hypothetical protein n=1 Tax=Mycolicibacterium elephantis TaxID=81858 RepID=UPI000A777044|nr:hypothetical protein [Mycolicibacterium elephantis]
MAIRQSVLALYGAITEDLATLNDPEINPTESRASLRAMTTELVGLTGSAGERGWYGELIRYFDAHRTGAERVVPTSLEEALEDFDDEDGGPLPPTWAYRAIAAGYVLDRLTLAGVGRRQEADLLERTIAAAPSVNSERVGRQAANELAGSLLETRVNQLPAFSDQLRLMSGTLAPAVASMQSTSRLRKVKREYCSVVTTTAEWSDITYQKLKSVIEPVNWSSFWPDFFCEMRLDSTPDACGWSRILESVSGDCTRYSLETPLKFWKQEHSDGLFLNYDMDYENADPERDKLVLVDNGYIWIKPAVAGQPDKGVKVRTSKQLLISGLSATAMTKLAESLGWATNATDMFLHAAKYPGSAAPFANSNLIGKPQPDTSTTWRVVVPELPPDLRDEYCADTTELIKRRLDDAGRFAEEYAVRWQDGIDLVDIDKLNEMVVTGIETASKEAFDTAVENFRPKAPTP